MGKYRYKWLIEEEFQERCENLSKQANQNPKIEKWNVWKKSVMD